MTKPIEVSPGASLASPTGTPIYTAPTAAQITNGTAPSGPTSTSSPTTSGSYPTTSLQPGSTGSDVTALQTYLVANGYMTQADMDTGPGTYGPKTTAAVLKLQQSLGIDYSSGPGYFGPKTIAALGGITTSTSTPTTTTSTRTI